jgi:hypothetical protein
MWRRAPAARRPLTGAHVRMDDPVGEGPLGDAHRSSVVRPRGAGLRSLSPAVAVVGPRPDGALACRRRWRRRSHPGERSSAHGPRFARRREGRVAWMGVAAARRRGRDAVARTYMHGVGVHAGAAGRMCGAERRLGAARADRCGAGRWSGDVRLAAGRAVMRRWPQPAPRGASRCPRPRLSARRSPRCCPP